MNANKTYIRRYRFNLELIQKLDKLRQLGINPSHFVRQAIEEKFKTDYPKIKAKANYIKTPF